MKSVAQLLRAKPVQEVFTISPQATVLDAAKMMRDKNIGALLVTSSEDIVGIVSERDFARKLFGAGKAAEQTCISEVMSTPVKYVHASQSNEECMALMTDGRLRHLPVLDNGKLIGVISIGDLVKDVICEQQFIISQLENYIHG